MFFDSVNLREELEKEQNSKASAVVSAAEALLAGAVEKEGELKERLGFPEFSSGMKPQVLEANRWFGKEAIEATCTKFRLRFLNVKMFKGNIPVEALQEIRAFEKEHGFQPESYRVMAPARLFRLKDASTDPLLFAEMGNGHYYLICQWGNDMAWYRKLANFPLRSLHTLAITAIFMGVLAAMMVPAAGFLNEDLGQITVSRIVYFKLFASFILSGLFFVTGIIVGILRTEDFSQNVWNSRYFN